MEKESSLRLTLAINKIYQVNADKDNIIVESLTAAETAMNVIKIMIVCMHK